MNMSKTMSHSHCYSKTMILNVGIFLLSASLPLIIGRRVSILLNFTSIKILLIKDTKRQRVGQIVKTTYHVRPGYCYLRVKFIFLQT